MRIKPRKRYGQHFLTDQNIARRIITSAALEPRDTVVEIGAGTGALTRIITALASKVIAIEIDPQLCTQLEALKHELALSRQRASLEIVQADFLKLDLEALLAGTSKERVRIIGNLPYNVATRIIEKLLERKRLYRDATLMVQREVAARLLALPGTKDYGALTNLAYLHADLDLLFHVKPGAFFPPPQVESSVIKLRPLEPMRYELTSYQLYCDLLRCGFAHRRKTILNNLKRCPKFSRHALRALEQAGIAPELRAEAIRPPEWAQLANALAKIGQL